jgi:RNA polymerase sigma-70 factor, ECF subfamily
MQVSLAVPPRKKPPEIGALSTDLSSAPPGDPLAQVVADVAAGDRAAFRALYDATAARVFGLSLQILRDRAAAEEAAVDVYAQIWRQASRYEIEKGSVATWITSMARTRAIDLRRTRARAQDRETALDEVQIERLCECGRDPVEASAESERAGRVRGALDSLPHEQRRAVEAAFFGGLSHTEIAQALGQPLGTVKTRIRSGLSTLRRALATHESEFA